MRSYGPSLPGNIAAHSPLSHSRFTSTHLSLTCCRLAPCCPCAGHVTVKLPGPPGPSHASRGRGGCAAAPRRRLALTALLCHRRHGRPSAISATPHRAPRRTVASRGPECKTLCVQRWLGAATVCVRNGRWTIVSRSTPFSLFAPPSSPGRCWDSPVCGPPPAVRDTGPGSHGYRESFVRGAGWTYVSRPPGAPLQGGLGLP